MRIAIVNASELGKDWRAEAHVPAPLERVRAAHIKGWERGMRGTTKFGKEAYFDIRHGRPEVRDAFWEGYNTGLKLRKEFLEGLDAT